MKYTLKDYQNEAVKAVLKNLKKARKQWREDSDRNAFSLTAPTGAGKTVMAAAALEALFHGDDGFEFDRDPGAVVIWFSDDPSLNEQTRHRLADSSDKLRSTDLVVVGNTFNRPKLEAGKIYFLNTQKLGKNSLLVRGSDDDEIGFPEMRPDLRSHTFWDILRNTIEDPELTLYLALDEAHRGMGKENNEKSPIVKRLINGAKGTPGIPVVWGISATVERFNRAMEGALNRAILSSVTVDVTRVQDSGLIKDTIVLDCPDEMGDFDTTLVRRAADKLKESTTEWAAYAAQQKSVETVIPLMVLQLPNTPNPNDVGKALDVILERLPELSETSIAHVLGEHKTQTFGRHSVPYIQPQDVQKETIVRVLIAKDAISTGWDCPRAEVIVSFRPANDYTYIAQLLGRMVRTPLARRIPGNDKLNSVECLLPKFDKANAQKVINALLTGSSETLTPGRILMNPQEMIPNPKVTDEVWEKFVSLPSQTRPQKAARPPIRLTALAHELAFDKLLENAGSKAHSAMHKALDDYIAKHVRIFEEKRASVLTLEGRTIITNLRSGEIIDKSFQMEADDAVITDAFRRSARILSPDIARTYTLALAKRKDEDDLDDALIEAREDVAALHLMENLQYLIDSEAKKLSDAWLKQYHEQIKGLPDERQETYRQIIALSDEPQDVDLARPVSRYEPTKKREMDGNETVIPTYDHHLLCDEQGKYPALLGSNWEVNVIEKEMKRPGFLFWYRNPPRPSQDSLGIAYTDADETRIVRPDFIFFSEQEGKIVADLVDPHGAHLAESLPKLKGLARYAEAHPDSFRRIEVVAELNGKSRRLDLTRPEVRNAVKNGNSAESLYKSSVAGDYH
jgi:hypothetical protein